MLEIMSLAVILFAVFLLGMVTLVYTKVNSLPTEVFPPVVGNTRIPVDTFVISANSSVRKTVIIPVNWMTNSLRFSTTGVEGEGRCYYKVGTTVGGSEISEEQDIFSGDQNRYNTTWSPGFTHNGTAVALTDDLPIYITVTSTYSTTVYVQCDYRLMTITDFAGC